MSQAGPEQGGGKEHTSEAGAACSLSLTEEAGAAEALALAERFLSFFET